MRIQIVLQSEVNSFWQSIVVWILLVRSGAACKILKPFYRPVPGFVNRQQGRDYCEGEIGGSVCDSGCREDA